MRGRGRDFVVDADVARSAEGAEAVERRDAGDLPVAVARQQTLDALLDARHRVVFSPRLHREWHPRSKRAPSRDARRWLARMVERRLLVRLAVEPSTTELDEAIDAHLPSDTRALAHKDAHLIAIAGAHGRRIISGDDRARAQFARLARCDGVEIGDVHWVDPIEPDVRRWLLARAPDRPDWTLAPPEP